MDHPERHAIRIQRPLRGPMITDKLTETTTQLADIQSQIRNTDLQLAINSAEAKVVEIAAALERPEGYFRTSYGFTIAEK